MTATAPAKTTTKLIDRVLGYDGHSVIACRTGAGKTFTVLNYIAQQSKAEPGCEWLIGTGKQSAWMGLEDQFGQDGQSRVLNISVTDAESIQALLKRLRWVVKIQESREVKRVSQKRAGQSVKPRPIRIILDEWIVICKAAKRLSKDAFQELIDLVEIIVFKGREDKVFLTLIAQGHHCGTLHLDGDLRTNLGVIALGGGGNYQSITAAINDSDLIQDKPERQALQAKYQALIEENPTGRIFYTSIGGHTVGRMEELPDRQSEILFQPDPVPQTDDKFGEKHQAPEKSAPKKPKLVFEESNDECGDFGSEPSEASEFEEFVEEPVRPRRRKRQERDSFQDEQLDIERDRLGLETTALRLKANAANLDAEARWNLITLGFGTLVALVYVVPPFSGAAQGAWKLSVKTAQVAQETTKKVEQGASKIDDIIQGFAPDLKRSPKIGERIAGYPVTSAYGPRSSPGGIGSTDHKGVDIGAPTGTPVYAIGKPGDKIKVRCLTSAESNGGGNVAQYVSLGWEFNEMHLSKCFAGDVVAGTKIGEIGSTGNSTGPHMHHGMRNPKTRQWVPPMTGFVWAALTGELPKPVFNRGNIEENK